MICPECGTETPETQLCPNCGAPLAHDAEPDATPDAASDAAPDAAPGAASEERPSGQRGVYQWNDVPQGDDVPRRPGRPPKLALAIAAVAVAAVAALLFALSGAPGANDGDGGGASAQDAAGSSGPAASSQAAADGSDDADAGASASASGAGEAGASGGSDGSATSATPASASASPAGKAVAVDARAFDASGNPTLFALLGLDGAELADALEASGFTWVDSACTWMSASGALVEAQDSSGPMKRGEVVRLDKGAEGSPAVVIAAATGYDTPQSALDGLSGNVSVKQSYVGPDGDIAFAVVRAKGGRDHLVAISKTGEHQQTALVFTEKAVEEGMFADIAGVDAGDSIKKVWKVLTARQDAE